MSDGQTHSIEQVVAWIDDHDDFLIASHMDPDGDSLGSSLALAAGLRHRGKRTTVMIGQPLSARHLWLPRSATIESGDRAPATAKAVILVECSDFARSGLEGLEVLASLNIDHHTKNALYADVNWIDSTVAAAGMMIRTLLDALGAPIDADMAAQLYVTVLTDTGSFHHSNTDAAALSFAAGMVERGALPEAISKAVYGNVPAAQVHLLADALSTLTTRADGRVAWMRLGLEQFDRRGTTDTEGFINQIQNIAGVRVSLLFKEVDPGSQRVSLRSDGSVDVAELAAQFGGGGHPRAAGCLIQGALATISADLFERIERALIDGNDE